jgi:exonuclease SbcC
MKLHIQNFCCYDDRVFEFPDNGNVLITAPSGEGKTSILKAIQFALFGTGQKIIQHGKKKCSVNLTYKNLKIQRTKGPCRLVVNDTHEDEEAQNIINETFSNSMHLTQDTKTSFVMMSPMEKLDFISSIAFHSIDIQGIKKKIKNVVKEHEVTVIHKKTELESCLSILKDISVPEIKDPEQIQGLSLEEEEEQLDRLKRLSLKVKNIQADIEFETKTLDAHRNDKSSYDEKLSAINIDKDGLVEDRKVLDQITNNEKHAKLKRERDQQKKIYDESIKTERDDLESKIEELQGVEYEDVEPKLKNLKRQSEYNKIHDQYISIDIDPESIVSIQESLAEKKRILTTLNSDLECPGCQSKLYMQNGKLQLQCVVEDVPTLKRSIKESEEALSKLRELDAKKQWLKTKLDTFKLTHTPVDPNEIQQLEKIRDENVQRETLLDSYFDRLETVEAKYARVKDSINSLTKKLKDIPQVDVEDTRADVERRIRETEKQQNQFDIYTESVQRVCSKIKTSETRLGELRDKLSGLPENDLDFIECRVKVHISNIELLKQYTTVLLYNKYETKKQDLEREVFEAERHLVSVNLLRKKIMEAEIITIENIVHTINTNVQTYLDEFFEHEPLYASIVQVEKSSKTQMMLDIQYKGHVVDVSNLSGGERDRVILAFTMTIAEMGMTPVLLLDECVSSLDQENANNVFECIKTQCKDKLVILVAHQIVTGMFDQIITL